MTRINRIPPSRRRKGKRTKPRKEAPEWFSNIASPPSAALVNLAEATEEEGRELVTEEFLSCLIYEINKSVAEHNWSYILKDQAHRYAAALVRVSGEVPPELKNKKVISEVQRHFKLVCCAHKVAEGRFPGQRQRWYRKRSSG